MLSYYLKTNNLTTNNIIIINYYSTPFELKIIYPKLNKKEKG